MIVNKQEMERIWQDEPHGYAKRYVLKRGQKITPMFKFIVTGMPYKIRKDYGEPVVVEVVAKDRSAASKSAEMEIRSELHKKYGWGYSYETKVEEAK